MQNKKLIALIILSILAVFSLIYGLTSPPRTRRRTFPSVSGIKKDTSVEKVRVVATSERHAKRSSYITWGRSPFAPREIRIKKITTLTLNGIMWDNINPKAIINNNIVGIGDRIGKGRVVEINRDNVILNDGTRNFELRTQ
jgi:hypothetical protein